MRIVLLLIIDASSILGLAFQSAFHVSVSAVTGSPRVDKSRQRSVFSKPSQSDGGRDKLALLTELSSVAPLQPVGLSQGIFSYHASGVAFPKWLTEFTGMTEWPGLDPPYIPLDFVDFEKIPEYIKPYEQGNCDPELRYKSCLFDCYNCAAFDDVYTCPVLLQTFDDGPSMATLGLLSRLRQRSTFFTLGINTVRFPEIYRATVARGHIMGSHTWSHKFLPSLSNEAIVAQIEWLVWAMNATSGHLPKWFRPPYGGIDDRVRAIVRQFGMQAVLWDFDTTDWKLLSEDNSDERREEDIYRDLEKFRRERGGRGLILEHDGVDRTARVGIEISDLLSDLDQMTVPECVGGIPYIKQFY